MLQFHEFVAQFGKNYHLGTAEWVKRESIFNKNLEAIMAQNERYEAGESLWTAGINHFADLEEFEMAQHKGYSIGAEEKARKAAVRSFKSVNVADLPDFVDWRQNSAVTPVKNQAACGSCWAHAAVETIESHAQIQLGTLWTLSPQQLVDCVQNPDQCGGTGGCEGATAEVAFNYTKFGIHREADYKYTGRDQTCSVSAISPPVLTVGGYVQLPINDAPALMDAVANVGPVSISVAAGKWSFYSGGVYDGRGPRHGNDFEVDHAVQMVGYGTDEKTKQPYWLVRNSWGPSWGEKGYIRLARFPGNEICGEDLAPLDGVCGKSGECQCGSNVTYCGTSAVLSDSSYPTGLSLV